MRRALILTLVVGIGVAGLRGISAAVAATAPPGPPPASARLQGAFLLSGHITVAVRVRGEHRGARFRRTWTFVPNCPSGPCPTIGLIRERAGGADRLLLRLRSPGLYTGKGRFYAPLRCGHRRYARGESVPYTVSVRVTAAMISGGAVLATRISAAYTNRSRTNLTPCVAIPGHDAASYRGQLIVPGT